MPFCTWGIYLHTWIFFHSRFMINPAMLNTYFLLKLSDIWNYQFVDGSFDVILDKGGLDALMEPGAGTKLGIKYLNEVYRWIYAEFGCPFLVVVMDRSVDPNGNAFFLVICMIEQASFAGQESYEIRREVCVPYPCRIPCFRLFSVNSRLLFSFSY